MRNVQAIKRGKETDILNYKLFLYEAKVVEI